MTQYPNQWDVLGLDFKPQDKMIDYERFDKRQNKKVVTKYLGVPYRLMWFITDQRQLIVAGIATCSYVIRTELVEHDTAAGTAQFKTYIRDVLGNEATMYGSESVKDFGDYLEKASTKSVGRTLLMLGYGTLAANELDEGERIVDAPTPSKESKSSNGTAAKKETATVSNKPVANTVPSDTNAVDFNLEEKLRLLAERFGYTLMDLNLYATSRGISWHRPSIINLIDALEDHEKAFKVIAHFTKIPFETFQDYVQKTGKTWNIMYTFASNPRRQDFYNAVYPQNTTQQPLSQSNIPAGSI